MTWLEYCVTTDPGGLDALTARLTANGAQGLVIEDESDFHRFLEENRQYWDYVDQDLMEKMAGAARVKFYVPATDEGRAEAAGYLAGVDGAAVAVEAMEEEDWANGWKKYYQPLEIGRRLYVVPEWLPREAPEGRVSLVLNPGLTFGTGAHPTTQLCLEGVERCAAQGQQVLDLGCGSGILSIAALKLGAAYALGVDIDPKAPDVARENGELNGVSQESYRLLAGDVLGDKSLQKELAGRRWDLILANIVADVIIPLAEMVGPWLAPGGRFLCAGIIDTRAGEVRAALEKNGFFIENAMERKGWCAYQCRWGGTGMSRQTAKVAPLVLETGRRTFCVSDIHGNLPLLKGLLDKLAFSREDTLIVMGDIVERNTGSLATLRFLMDLRRRRDVRFILGNCDNLVLDFVDAAGELPDDFFERWIGNLGGRSVLVQMAEEAGIPLNGRGDYPRAREVFRTRFHREMELFREMPHILLNDDYLLVHGGVPREHDLESLIAFDCMKNDHFWEQGRVFQRWVIAGHTPVTLYRGDIPSAAPIIDPASRIISIDGGCTLKADGQLNALLLPEDPAEGFSWVSYDGFPTVTALDRQAPSETSVNIRWGRSALELLERGEVFSLCRHVETGRELEVLNEYLRFDENGVHCEDSTDYRLPVEPGDALSVVRAAGERLLCKKDGVTGWYFGRYE